MNGALGFDRPEFLWLLAVILPLIGLTFWTRRKLGVGRRLWALGARLALVLALIFALAELSWRKPVDDLAVVFVVDRSASVGPAGQQQALDFVRTSLQARGSNDRAGLVVFGAEALVDAEPREDLEVHGIESTPSPHQTDIAAGLRLGTALLPGDLTRRLVLLTDGEQTRGDAAGQALLTASDDLEISVVPLDGASGADVLVEDVIAPARVDRDAPFELRIVARSDEPTTGTLRLYRNDVPIGQMPVPLEAGRSRVVTLRQPGAAPGLYRYRVELEADPAVDSLPQNNRGVATVQVRGQPRVLLAEREPDQAHHLVGVLEAEGLVVDLVLPEHLPAGLDGLRAYDALFLSDVPAYVVSGRQQEAIRSFVRDLGRGLVMIGGPESFGLGGWYRSPVEDALPVRMDIEDRSRFPKLAMVLAIDKSCSMGDGGGSKLAMAREAAIQTAELLSDRDQLGVIAFDGAASWISPLRPLTDRQQVLDDIAGLRVGGGTHIYPALKRAFEALDGSDAGLKHVVLLSDGITQDGDYQSLITGAHARHITLTAIGLGNDADKLTLDDFAQWGGGSSYLVTDPHAIPAIFTREALLASRSFLVEEPFQPEAGMPSELVRGLDLARFPTLHGHVATDPKPRATVALLAPHEEAPTPLLAHWRFGLGRAVAFTSDAKGRWGKDWVRTESYVWLWTQMARWVVGGDSPDLAVDTRIVEGELHVVVDAFDGAGGFRNFLEGQARVVGPDLSVTDLPLRQVGPGRYEGRLPVDQDGSWLVGVSLSDKEQIVGQAVSEAVQPYSPEYRSRGSGAALAAELGRVGRGGLLSDPAEVFRRPEIPRLVPKPLWPLLIPLAAVLLLLDVAIRRLDLRRSAPGAVTVPEGSPSSRGLPLKGPLSATTRGAAAEVEEEEPVGPPPVEVDPASYAGRLLAARRAARKKLDEDHK